MRIATVCSGIGSPEQGLRNLGIDHEVVFACEIDKYARQTYLANFIPNHMYQDMTKEEWDLPEQYADLFIGGIPCQAFSLAGKRLGELDKRGLLFYDFYRYVKNQQPKVFIIENVKGLLSDANGRTFKNWCQLLGESTNGLQHMFPHPDSLGYTLYHKVLNSKNFGVPQNRERVFLVGIRSDIHFKFKFPKGWKLTKRLKDVLESNVDEKYYLSDKMIQNLVVYNQRQLDNGTGFTAKFRDVNGIMDTIKVGGGGKDDLIAEPTKIERVGFINQDTQASAVISENGISSTINAGTHGYAHGYIEVKEATLKGYDIAEPGDSINYSNSNSNSKTRRGRVGKGIANTLDTACNKAIIEPVCVAMRGRNPENPNDRTPGAKMEQRLEINSNGTTNTLTSVHKDNLILLGGIKDGQLTEGGSVKDYSQGARIYDTAGLSCTLSAGGGGQGGKTGLYKENARIRRLTPLECFRLQDFPDEFIKPVSDTQLYKQSGNSITVGVIQAIEEVLLPIFY